MINVFIALIAYSSLPGPAVEVQVRGRDYSAVAESAEQFSGLCDGKKASVTIMKGFDGAKGRMTIEGGGFSRPIPETFLDGALPESSFYAAALLCDGQRVMFRARYAVMNAAGAMIVRAQSVSLDVRTGELKVRPVQELPAEDVRYQLRAQGASAQDR